jgi:superfamily II DNA or RNA helicase
MTFTETDVRDWVGPDVYRKALPLVGSVEDVAWGEAARAGDLLATGRTVGARVHEITLMRMRGYFSSTCTCGDRRNCMHGAALALAIRARSTPAVVVAEPDPAAAPAPTGDWQARLAAWTAPASAPSPPVARATFAYRLRWPIGPDGTPELQIQVSHASGPTFHALGWHLYKVGQGDSESDFLVEPAIRRIRSRRPVFRDGETRTAGSWLVVPAESLEDLLPRLGLHPRVEDERCRPLTIHPTLALKAGLAYKEDANGPELRPIVTGPRGPVAREDATAFGAPGARWVVTGREVFRLEPAAEAAWADGGAIRVPDEERRAFEQRWLPALAAAGVLVDAREKPLGDWPQGTPKPQLVLEEEPDCLRVRVGFVYGPERIEAEGPDAPAPEQLVGPPGGPLWRRDPESEARWLAGLRARLVGNALYGDAALAFLESDCPELVAAGWEVVGRDRVRHHRLARVPAVGRLSVRTGADWFDLHSEVLFGAETVEWRALKQALETGARYLKLGSGEWARVPADWLAAQRRMRDRFETAAIEAADPEALRLPLHHAPFLAEVLDAEQYAEVDAGWRAFREKLSSFGGIAPAPVSAGFTGTLRPYQQLGLNYLSFLRDHGLHGILADDMGLGKTVQAAALLAANHPSADGPSLIVAPTSLVDNWVAELGRFVPGLRVLKLHGTDRPLGAIGDADVVVTTYGTARTDLAWHRKRTYHTIILDEAQAIKNPRSQTAMAMRRLSGRHRLCLTGTPIENDTRELWSLFAFLMPGMLGTDEDFRARYATPISIGDPHARRELRSRIAPFILRRLKSQVAPDLPPRTDVVIPCELSPGQRRAYDMLLTGARERIQRSVEAQGLDRSRITILDALLKLRQACCHPALLNTPETMHLESGKLEAALTLITELVEGGHRALVFSQFTSMLAILREKLDALGLAYEYLDGATRDRQSRVDRFNASDTPLFLISLKAGGTGLNLTGADYVIHYDPWWNPAAEDQATDRAHRIGQTRHVFNYKLVATNTIEEKLLHLQTEKRGLARDLLATDATGKTLTAADVEALFA